MKIQITFGSSKFSWTNSRRNGNIIQINYQIKYLNECMGILNRLKRFLPIQTKVLIYNSLVLSHLNFGILLWGVKCDKLFFITKQNC